MTVSAVWTIADIFNGLMAFPNLVALVALSGVVAAETKTYFDKKKRTNKRKMTHRKNGALFFCILHRKYAGFVLDILLEKC